MSYVPVRIPQGVNVFCKRVSGRVEDIVVLGVLLREHNEFKDWTCFFHSLPRNFMDASWKVDHQSLDIACFTETWLDQSYPEASLQIPGYCLFPTRP